MPQYIFNIAKNIEIDECNEILNLIHRSFKNDSQTIYSLKMFIDFGNVFLCYNEKKLASVIQCMSDLNLPDTIQITSVSTDPEYSGKGAASFATQNMIDYYTKKGIKQIAIRIPTNNMKMRRIFCEKYDFKIIKLLTNYFGHKQDRFYLEKSIQSDQHLKNKDTFFDLLVNYGLIKVSSKVSGRKIKNLLDPFPINLVNSDYFELMEIPIESVKPIGDRFLPQSKSIGPIVVDINPHWCNNGFLNNLGQVIIIEGKHRWLDLKEIGKTTILAWVGSKAKDFVIIK